MKFIHKFDTIADFNTGIKNYEEPWVSYTKEINRVDYNNVIDTNGHEFVNLGLPSGTLWATCNVGASSYDELGTFFAWGEITGDKRGSANYKNYSWNDYSLGTSTSNLTKYNSTDNKTVLDLEDDAAHVIMGGNWCMPTLEQIQELINSNNCTISSVLTDNNSYVISLKSKTNNNFLYLPINKRIWQQSSDWTGTSDNIAVWLWTSSLSSSIDSPKCLNINDSLVASITQYYRPNGMQIRGVITAPQILNS